MSDRRVERFTRKIEEQEEMKEEEDMTTLCWVIDKTGMYKYTLPGTILSVRFIKTPVLYLGKPEK